jgi:hypothetical protein
VDAANVYWADGANVWRLALSGGTPESLVAGPAMASSGSLATQGSNLYWSDPVRGLILSVPIDGGAVTTLATGQSWPQAIAVGSSGVSWACSPNPQGAPGGETGVFTVGLSGGSVFTIAANVPVTDLAQQNDSLYWVAGGASPTGTLATAPVSGGTVVTIETGLDAPTAVAVAGSDLYWLMGTNNDVVMRKPLGGGADVTLVSSSKHYASGYLAADRSGAYWTSYDGVWFVSPSGTHVNLAPIGPSGDPGTPTSLAVDSKFVYYIQRQYIMRVAKSE